MVWKLDRDALVSQTSSTWGLGSISHRTPNHTNYIFNPNGGQGTFAYVVDSGIRTTHTEFEDRAFLGYNAFPDTEFVDRLGHGTHVSATIAGKTYGVAKKATLIAVRVFDTGEVRYAPLSNPKPAPPLPFLRYLPPFYRPRPQPPR